jgi:purine-binding chemotaxis protein CheW
MDDFSGRLVLFRVAGLVCAAETGAVREILPLQRATRIPGAPAAVQGLINVRGDLVTLLDGARLLGRTMEGPAASLILMRWGDVGVAVAVEEVLDLVPKSEADLADREQLVGLDPTVVRAVGQHAGRTFIVLDLDALLGPLLAA